MPSSLSHGMVAVALGSAVAPRRLLRPFLVIGAVCAVIPDIDAIGRLGNGGDDAPIHAVAAFDSRAVQ